VLYRWSLRETGWKSRASAACHNAQRVLVTPAALVCLEAPADIGRRGHAVGAASTLL
jgi:hypothetical protein